MLRKNNLSKPLYLLFYPIYRMLSFAYKIDLSPNVQIGNGLRIFHPFSIAIGPGSVIGSNCVLRHGVTIGNDGSERGRYPTIGDNVEFGCFALVLGAVKIPNDVLVPAASRITSQAQADALKPRRK